MYLSVGLVASTCGQFFLSFSTLKSKEDEECRQGKGAVPSGLGCAVLEQSVAQQCSE